MECGWSIKHIPSPRVTTPYLVVLGQTIWALVGGPQKIMVCWSPAPCNEGVADKLKTRASPICITVLHLVILSQRRYIKKLRCTVALLLEVGDMSDHLQTHLSQVGYRAKSDHCWSNSKSVCIDIQQKNWGLTSCLSRSHKLSGTDTD